MINKMISFDKNMPSMYWAKAFVSYVLARRELDTRRDPTAAISEGLPMAPAPRDGLRHPGLRRALDLLHARFTEDLSVDELAAAAGLSIEHLIRSFRRQVGLPPHRYLLHLRVARARTLRARDDPDPASRNSRPVPPPPRAALA